MSQPWIPPPGPGYEHGLPPEWFKRPEQQHRGRSPPRSYSPGRASSPHGDHSKQRSHGSHIEQNRPLSPRNERPGSPRNDQQSNRRGISPIRPPSPSRERMSSPRRDRPPSPGRERFSPRRDKPPSPGRERPRSPYGWRRSPPRHYYEWRRSRSPPPPHWIRRSPPRYGPPPSGRSPPRGPWHPPPDWDRYRRPYPDRRSPPRYGPPGPPPPHWERRWPPPPLHPDAPPHHADRYPPHGSSSKSSPPRSTDSKPESRGEDALLPADDKEEEIESFDLGPYDPDIAVGQKYVIAVSGFFCKVCHKFYNSESSAKLTHCKTKTHYDKFAKWLSEKKVAALVQKRALKDENKNGEQPPSKQIKIEQTEENTADTDSKYDPSQPTPDAPADQSAAEKPTKEDREQSSDIEPQKEIEPERNASTELDDSESDPLITNETKKNVDGDHIEATLFNLRKLKVNQLKANLEKRGMKSTGLKPLLLKRLEKVLAEEAATASAAEPTTEEETNKEQLGDGDEGKEYLVKMLESDVEPANRKTQWISEKELEEELMQMESVKKIVEIKSERSGVFNGRRTNVEWSIKMLFSGDFPEEGLQFSLTSHQQLPFVVALPLEDE